MAPTEHSTENETNVQLQRNIYAEEQGWELQRDSVRKKRARFLSRHEGGGEYQYLLGKAIYTGCPYQATQLPDTTSHSIT